jgi:hypothetical protein
VQDQILDQPADFIVDQSGADGGTQAKTATQSPRHIILTASFPDFKHSGGADAPLAGVQTQHDLSQSNQVVSASISGFYIEIENGHTLRCHVDD